MVTISEVRAIINIFEANELSDDAVQEAIDRATDYIGMMADRSAAPDSIVELAKKNYAAYLAYLTYSDRVVNILPGSMDSEGIWGPVAEVISRDVMHKLQAIKGVSDASLRQLSAYGMMGRIVRPGWLLY